MSDYIHIFFILLEHIKEKDENFDTYHHMHGNNMAEVMDTIISKVTNDFKVAHTNVTGVFITDNKGLTLASHDVKHDSGGAIALLADLASALLERTAIVCMENGDQKLIIREAGKTVFSIYTETTRR